MTIIRQTIEPRILGKSLNLHPLATILGMIIGVYVWGALGFLIGCLLGMERKKRVAVSIEVGMQNSGLASSLATMHFAAYPMATIPGALFSVWHNISGALLAKIYAHKAEATTVTT